MKCSARRLMLVVGWLLSQAAMAQDAATPAPSVPSWEVGAGWARTPDYSGSTRSSSHLRTWLDASYRSDTLGRFELDSGSLTLAPALRWRFLDGDAASLGVQLGYRDGRDDRRPGLTGLGAGSDRLRGLPAVPGRMDAGLAGHRVVLGLPVFAQWRTALRSGQGSLVQLGIYAPLKPGPDVEITVLPTLTWADARQVRAFYGVDAIGAAASGFAPYRPAAGWQDAALEIAADWTVAGPWHLVASLAHRQLLGDAARSPLVERRGQSSALLGLVWHH